MILFSPPQEEEEDEEEETQIETYLAKYPTFIKKIYLLPN
jgi:hypothetical protein